MSTAAAKKQSGPHVIRYISQAQLIANINSAVQAFEAVAPKLSDDRIGITLKNIASGLVLAKNVYFKPNEHIGIDFNKTMNRVEHALSNLFGERALAANPIAAQAHKTFIEALKGSAYDITR